MIIILSAPSGCGKSSLAKKLLEDDANLTLSVSATTRKPRPGEIEGIDYFFKTKDEFEKLDLIEHAEIYSNYYGTPREFIDQKLAEDLDVLFDIDYQGADQIMKGAKAKIVSIFILPPDIETLRKRMINRAQDSAQVIEHRLTAAVTEIEHAKHYNYQVINNHFDQAVKEIKDIILFERNNKIYDKK